MTNDSKNSQNADGNSRSLQTQVMQPKIIKKSKIDNNAQTIFIELKDGEITSIKQVNGIIERTVA